MELKIDAGRAGKYSTGVLTSALDPNSGKERAADISELDTESLVGWLKASKRVSRQHAEHVVLTLLGHLPISCDGDSKAPQPNLRRDRETASFPTS